MENSPIPLPESAAVQHRQIRLVSIGSNTLAGIGDGRAMGWIGRVLAQTPTPNATIESYVLAAPDETTSQMSQRWEREALPRFSEHTENRMIVALGTADATVDGTSARARLNLANILDRAMQENIQVMVLGPAPVLDQEENSRLEYFNDAYKDVAERRDVTYVDAFNSLRNHDQYRQDLVANQGMLGQASYGLLAWLVLNRGWYKWMQLSAPQN